MLAGLYGGTFDPIHVGHIHAANAVRTALGLDQVHMILAARPGHRGMPSTGVEHRWQMLCMACEPYPGLVPDRSEVGRQGQSYTVDTVQAFGAAHPGVFPCWIMGQDAFATLPIWHRWQSLMDHCNFIVVDRPGESELEPEPVTRLYAAHCVDRLENGRNGQILRLDLPMLKVSATAIRARLRRGLEVTRLLDAPVRSYIQKHMLYTEDAA